MSRNILEKCCLTVNFERNSKGKNVNFKKLKQRTDKIIYTVIATILLVAIIASMVSYTHKKSVAESYEMLHTRTQHIKEDLRLQMISDHENLDAMASFVAELYSINNEEGFDILFNSFKKIGLLEDIGILLPNNIFITKRGMTDLSGKISFDDETAEGEYISGRVNDFTRDDRQVIRRAVPVKDNNGNTIAILYGIISLETLNERYRDEVDSMNADLFVLEIGNGNLIVDTRHDILENVISLVNTPFADGFSFEKMIDDFSAGQEGYTSFRSLSTTEYMYAHYAPLGISDWQIMLLQPEGIVMARAHEIEKRMAYLIFMVAIVIAAYVTLMFLSERRKLKISKNTDAIRKCLLGLNQQFDRVYEAFKRIIKFANSRSAFFIDPYGTDYGYIAPVLGYKLLVGEDRAYFISELWSFVEKNNKNNQEKLYLDKIVVNQRFKREMPDFYEFLNLHEIKTINFAYIVDNENNTSILGVINGHNHVEELLQDIAICFTMAVYNQKHLAETEKMALVDALTGIANRMAYKEDIKKIFAHGTEKLGCIYIDVNELSYINNTYGHASGDRMLKYIADVLKAEFHSNIYRMGGDELLIFTEGLSHEEISAKISAANAKIEEKKYYISVGVKCSESGMTVDELVIEAERIMYAEKAKYYQKKEIKKMSQVANRSMELSFTGINEIDACMALLSKRYLGIYCVSHKIDSAFKVLTPSYFSAILDETPSFSKAMKKYIHDWVKPEYRRALINFLEYDALENNIRKGNLPQITFTKIDGEQVIFSVYPNNDRHSNEINTIWIFERKEENRC